MDTIVVCCLAYVALIALIYAPKCPKTATSPAPDYVDYFPTVEDVTAGDDLETKTENIADLSQVETAIAANPSPSLTTMSIRQLKAMAKGKIKGYSNLTKSQLIAALA